MSQIPTYLFNLPNKPQDWKDPQRQEISAQTCQRSVGLLYAKYLGLLLYSPNAAARGFSEIQKQFKHRQRKYLEVCQTGGQKPSNQETEGSKEGVKEGWRGEKEVTAQRGSFLQDQKQSAEPRLSHSPQDGGVIRILGILGRSAVFSLVVFPSTCYS